MMCAFMTPVIKSDWELFGSSRQGKGKKTKAGKLPSVSSAPDLMTRDQKLQRLREIQETRRLLLKGVPLGSSRSNSISSTDGRGYHRDGRATQSCHVSASNSRSHLPISPLALEGNNHKAKSSNSNKFHTKVIDRIKDVFTSKNSSSSSSSNKEEELPQQEQHKEQPKQQQQFNNRRRGSRSRVSSVTSFEFHKIDEEEIDVNGSVISP